MDNSTMEKLERAVDLDLVVIGSIRGFPFDGIEFWCEDGFWRLTDVCLDKKVVYDFYSCANELFKNNKNLVNEFIQLFEKKTGLSGYHLIKSFRNHGIWYFRYVYESHARYRWKEEAISRLFPS